MPKNKHKNPWKDLPEIEVSDAEITQIVVQSFQIAESLLGLATENGFVIPKEKAQALNLVF